MPGRNVSRRVSNWDLEARGTFWTHWHQHLRGRIY
jgi:hypothetical protein